MNSRIKKFIETHIQLLDNNDFEELYEEAYTVFSTQEIGLLTETLMKAGINPLDYLKDVPEAYLFDADVRELIIPEYITYIGVAAFAGSCLERIEIPDSIKTIDERAFQCCHLLKSITLPSTITNGIGDSAFDTCRGLKSVKLDAPTDHSVFASCPELEHIDFGPNIKYIGPWCFSGCPKLRKITIPANIKSIRSAAFHSCSALEEVTIEGYDTVVDCYAFNFCADNLTIRCLPGSLAEKYAIDYKIKVVYI